MVEVLGREGVPYKIFTKKNVYVNMISSLRLRVLKFKLRRQKWQLNFNL